MKKIFSLLLILGSLTFITSSCGSKKNVLSLSSIDGEWNILEINGDTVNSETQPFISFSISEKRVYGNSGCNSFNAILNVDSLTPGKISFGPISSTRMMCRDMSTEQSIMDAMSQVESYETISESPEEISLNNKDGEKLMLLEKRAMKPLSLSDLAGEWKIEAIKGKSAIGNQDVAPFIGFDINDNRIYGNVGCNSVNGELVQEASVPTSLSFKNVACTQMLCPDMETEQAVLESLNATRSFTKGLNGNIILLDADGAEVLVLSKR